MSESVNFVDNFLQGQQDCHDGKIPQTTNPDYCRGYAAQYAAEQSATELSRYQK